VARLAERALAVQTSPSARLNNYFFIVWPHQHDLATELIRQRMRKSVYPVSLVGWHLCF